MKVEFLHHPNLEHGEGRRGDKGEEGGGRKARTGEEGAGNQAGREQAGGAAPRVRGVTGFQEASQ